jgi:hypothetical protein
MPATTNVEASQSSIKQIDRVALEARLVRELDGGRAALPILPHVAAQAIRFANDPNSDLRKLAELVEGDPPIAARLLAVANSVIYTRAVRFLPRRPYPPAEGTAIYLQWSTPAHDRASRCKIWWRSPSVAACSARSRRVWSGKMLYRFGTTICAALRYRRRGSIASLANYKEALDPPSPRISPRPAAPVRRFAPSRGGCPASSRPARITTTIQPKLRTSSDGDDGGHLGGDVRAAPCCRGRALPALPTRRAAAARRPRHPHRDGSPAVCPPGDTPGPTSRRRARPTSGIWPTRVWRPDPGATWATKHEAPATPKTSNSSVHPAAASPVADTAAGGAEGSPAASLEDREAADFARLEGFKMDRELAETILSKLDDSIADLPL